MATDPVAASEAGPAVATTNTGSAAPANDTMADEESGLRTSADGSSIREKPRLERRDSTPLEERGRGRIALIMFALCVRTTPLLYVDVSGSMTDWLVLDGRLSRCP